MKYEQNYAGKDGWSKWRSPIHGKKDRNYRSACCDCGLVHEIQFRIKEGNVVFRVRRNNRATAAVRRGFHDGGPQQKRKEKASSKTKEASTIRMASRKPIKKTTKQRAKAKV